MSIPRATVRLQMNSDFTLNDACDQVDYFGDLGISHFYLSPISRARPGSTHGYDVVDHTVVSEELGGETALEELARTLRKRNMGLILDIVPNHMATHQDNRWWWDVLLNGRRSDYADFFDIDWQAPGLRDKVLAPFLARPYGESLRDGSVHVAVDESSGAPIIEACGARYPIAEGTLHKIGMDGHQAVLYYCGKSIEGRQRLHDLLERQHYRLSWWRCAADGINWRRFFEISDLIGVRVEQYSVFDAVHELPLRLYAEGLIDGLRIDHVDGLADPAAYCRRLRAALRARQGDRPHELRAEPAWLVVEKILASDERLPPDWQVDGSSGYDFMEQSGALFHDPQGELALTQEWTRVAADPRPVSAYVRDARDLMLRRHFVAERSALLQRLAELAHSGIEARDWGTEAIGRMLDEILLVFPHYRSYAHVDGRSAADSRLFARLIDEVRARAETHPYDRRDAETLLEWLDNMLGGKPLASGRSSQGAHGNRAPDPASSFTGSAADGAAAVPEQTLKCSSLPAGEPRLEVIRRFQQLTPPLAAKSLEDTVFYRYGRLLSRNEVGADPERLFLSVEEFHRHGIWRASAAPSAMLATATHDHKRGEDARARLAVLSELSAAWQSAARRWEAMAGRFSASPAGTAAERYMLFQTITAAWPLDLRPDDNEGLGTFGERLKLWQIKALREAKLNSNWVEPDLDYERMILDFIDGMMPGAGNHAILIDIANFVQRVAPAGAVNSLAQIVLRGTMPGIPDLYQGSEFWDFSLVDPDNRRPVDFSLRHESLRRLPSQSVKELLTDWTNGYIKQAVLTRTYALRSAMPEVFRKGSYQVLEVRGAASRHVIAFARCTGEGTSRAAFILAPLRCAAGVTAGQDGGEPRIETSFWRDTRVALPYRYAGAKLRNSLTGAEHLAGPDGQLNLADLLDELPVAIFHPV